MSAIEDDYEDEDDGGFYEDPDEDICACGQTTIGEGYHQCGEPLCVFCYSSQGGFCLKHPDKNYRPQY